MPCPVKQLGRAIPSCHDVWCHAFADACHAPRKTEIGQLQMSRRWQQQVIRFQILWSVSIAFLSNTSIVKSEYLLGAAWNFGGSDVSLWGSWASKTWYLPAWKWRFYLWWSFPGLQAGTRAQYWGWSVWKIHQSTQWHLGAEVPARTWFRGWQTCRGRPWIHRPWSSW